MEIFLSAVCAELASRSMSFIVQKYSKPPAMAVEDSLQRILLRAQVIVDEVAGRDISNQGMLQQLSKLRDAMYRGHHALDTFRYQAHGQDEPEDLVVSHSSTLSKFRHVRRMCLPSSSRETVKELQVVLNSLNTMILDVSELVVFLKNYPRLCRQPYSMHLLLGKCMFGRQMEMRVVINFLLCRQPHGDDEIDVLPIVGPGKVGKSTLVAHVCIDERVRDHFSQVVFLSDNDLFRDEILGPKYEFLNKHGRLLVIVELVGDLDEDAWKRLYSACKKCSKSGCKIIITSRTDKIMKFGTAHALILKKLSSEAYWYFFKVLTFGTMDPEMHPRLAYLAMEIASLLKESLPTAHVTTSLLRENFNIHYWCKVLAFLRGYMEQHVSKVGKHPIDLFDESKSIHLPRMVSPNEDLFVDIHYEPWSSQEEDIPKITLNDVIYGNTRPHGKFQVLAWKSHIPPYRNHISTCQIRDLQCSTTVKRKRSLNY